jgi:cytochrome c-type biogenesis protein CcmH/NrfF
MASRTRISLVVVVTASAALGLFSTNALEGMELRRTPVQAPRGIDATRSVLAINGDRDEDAVFFPHETHKQKLGGQQSCPKCHHQNLPHDEASACRSCHADMALKTSIFNHASHVAHLNDKWSCTQCHEPNQPKNSASSKPCVDCHREDMGLESAAAIRYDYRARSYTDAMHGQCMGCHERQDETNGTRMAECAFCHRHQQPNKPGARKAVSLLTGGMRL